MNPTCADCPYWIKHEAFCGLLKQDLNVNTNRQPITPENCNLRKIPIIAQAPIDYNDIQAGIEREEYLKFIEAVKQKFRDRRGITRKKP